MRNSVIFLLAVFMIATRSGHVGSSISLPDASLAIFFLAGVYQLKLRHFLALCAEAALIDYGVIHFFSVSDFCVSPAYIALLPAYSVLWFVGQKASAAWHGGLGQLPSLATYLAAATAGSFLLSNGSFFLFSGRVANQSLEHYLNGVWTYFPQTLAYCALYVVLAWIGVQIFEHVKNLNKQQSLT